MNLRRGYQPRNSLVMKERNELLVYSYKILNRWKNYFCQLLNVCEADGIWETKIHTTATFVQEPSASGVQVATKS
jgi:hypothetical protein